MNNSPRILYPIGSFYPSQDGGPCNTIYWMSKSLVKRSCEVTVITTTSGIKEKMEFNKWLNTNYGRVKYIPTRFHFFPLSLIFSTLSEIRKHDVVHLTSMFYPLSIITFIGARFYKKQVIWSPRGELDDGALIYKKGLKRILMGVIKRVGLSRIAMHSTAPQETLYIRKNFSATVPVIEVPNLMELPHFYNLPTRNYLLYVGRIHPKKNLLELVEALSMSEKFLKSGFQFKIAGNYNSVYGEKLAGKIRQLGLQDKIVLLGAVKFEEKEQLYSAAYFFFLPSITENFGNVVIEALSQGTPVVASSGTPWQLLEEKSAGYWVEPNSQSLSEIVDTVLTLDPTTYSDLRKNAYNLVRDTFEVDSNIHKWLAVYNSILN